eukprot:IDg8630t1
MFLAFFLALVSLTAVTRFIEMYSQPPERASGSDQDAREKGSANSADFTSFQANYLLVYLLAVTADWVQGPYVYALYTHYGYSKREIGQLYIAGFASSAVFGTVVAAAADKYGRRSNAMLYCAVYALSCVTKHSPSFWVLLIGRLCGGVATSILFSAFESWMVYEHTARGFAPRLLAVTFAKAQFGNGVVAIAAALIAGWFAERFGKVMPFDAALGTLAALAGVLATTWRENYGDAAVSAAGGLAQAWRSLVADERILLLGITQAAFESALYVFTFVWTPALQMSRHTRAEIPHGTIFATFMAATMMGSSVFAVASRFMRVDSIMRAIFATGVCAFAAALLADSIAVVYVSFVVFEVLCGVYYPAMATMRAPYIPEESRSALLTFFRVPLNVIVVVVLYEDLEINTVFAMCAMLMLKVALRLLAIHSDGPSEPGTKRHTLFPFNKIWSSFFFTTPSAVSSYSVTSSSTCVVEPGQHCIPPGYRQSLCRRESEPRSYCRYICRRALEVAPEMRQRRRQRSSRSHCMLGTIEHHGGQKKWWYSDEKEQVCGPFPTAKLATLFQEGVVDGLTVVTENAVVPKEEWMPISEVAA